MESLQWVDQTYLQKHESDDPSKIRAMYYPNLSQYSSHAANNTQTSPKTAMVKTITRYGRKAAISLIIVALSYIPYIGRLILPAASFYTFNRAVGPQPALIIFGSGLFLPRRYLVQFLQTYFASRSLMRDLVCHSNISFRDLIQLIFT